MADPSSEQRPTDNAVVQLATALGHPLRVRILRALAAGSSSATRLSREFGDVDQKDAFYHLRVLEKSDVVELERTRQVRGGNESIFRLRPRASWGKLWAALPLSVLSGWSSAGLRQFVEVALSALDAGALDNRDDSTFTAAPVMVDCQGYGEINDALSAALGIVDRVEAESRRRLKLASPKDQIGTMVAAAVFRVPDRTQIEGKRCEG
jgi:DNA-binding transcriptional ArsR family regulator